MPRAPSKGRSIAPTEESEVPLQVTTPKRVKQALDLMSAKHGRTRRALVLETFRGVAVAVSDIDIAGSRGRKSGD